MVLVSCICYIIPQNLAEVVRIVLIASIPSRRFRSAPSSAAGRGQGLGHTASAVEFVGQ